MEQAEDQKDEYTGLTRKEKKRKARKLRRLDQAITEHQQTWWESVPGVMGFIRGDHYGMADDLEDSDHAGDDEDRQVEKGDMFPQVHYTLSRIREMCDEIMREDDEIHVIAKDIVNFPGLGPDHPWSQLREQYAATKGKQQNEVTDALIAAELLQSRLEQLSDNRDLESEWEEALEYAALVRNTAVFVHYDESDPDDPVVIEFLDLGEWGYDPKSKGDVMSGEGCYVVREIPWDEFEENYGRDPITVLKDSIDDETIFDEDLDDDDDDDTDDFDDEEEIYRQIKRGEPVKVKLFFTRNQEMVKKPRMETVAYRYIDLTQHGFGDFAWLADTPDEEIAADLMREGVPQQVIPSVLQALEVEEVDEPIHDEEGKPVEYLEMKNPGGIEIVHTFKGRLLKCEPNWHPLGWCPLMAFPFIRVPRKVMGISGYDLTKDVNQTMDRGLLYFLHQAESSIARKWAVKELIENIDEIQSNDLDVMAIIKGGGNADRAIGNIPGTPVNDATLRGILQAQELGDEGLGINKADVSRAMNGDNAMAQEGIFDEMNKAMVRIRRRWTRFQSKVLFSALSLVVAFEDKETTAKIVRDNATPGYLVWNPTILDQLKGEGFKFGYRVEVTAPENVPRNRIARAGYKTRQAKEFTEILQAAPRLAKLVARDGDLPWTEDELSQIITDAEAAQKQPPIQLQIEQQKQQMKAQELKIKAMEVQANTRSKAEDLALKRAELNLKLAELVQKGKTEEMEHSLKAAELALEAKQDRAVKVG